MTVAARARTVIILARDVMIGWMVKVSGLTIVTDTMRQGTPGRTIILDTTECKRTTGARRTIVGAGTKTSIVRDRTGVEEGLVARTLQMEVIVNSKGETEAILGTTTMGETGAVRGTGAMRGATATTIERIMKWTTWILIGWFHKWSHQIFGER